MKKVMQRAYSALLIAALLVIGLVVYIIRFADDGGAWAMFTANKSVYANGMIAVGTVTDRNGTVLAHAEDGIFYYNDNYTTRLSCLHTVGDYAGNIGTGALTAFKPQLAGYSHITGVKEGGGTVALSIDAELNNTAYNALNGRSGAVMLMDYTTGEVLCMVSSPSYDPNTGFDSSSSAYEGVYINRCISATYVPGSVYKLVTLAAAIENISDIYERSFYCGGSVDVGGVTVTCTGTHGYQTIEQALANSCNCAFAEISLELGSDIMIKYAEKFGICEELYINNIPTKAGSVSETSAGSSLLAWTGIGQHNDLVSPYAMLRYVAAIANGGNVRNATLLKGDTGKSERLISSDTAGKIASMMDYTVTYAYGEWNFPGLNICAKSGTAEVGDGTSHSWFVGYLNDDEHPYAFVVLIEHGGSGLGNAGALANTLLQAAVGG